MEPNSLRIVLDPAAMTLLGSMLAIALTVFIAALLRRHRLDSLAEQAALYHDALERDLDVGSSPEDLAVGYDSTAFAYNVCRELPFSRAVARHYPTMIAPYGIGSLRGLARTAGVDRGDAIPLTQLVPPTESHLEHSDYSGQESSSLEPPSHGCSFDLPARSSWVGIVPQPTVRSADDVPRGAPTADGPMAPWRPGPSSQV